ncbi:MAG: hypothetical protein H0X39_09340 [Actinobacteria bacterium]|nr:hypothetical protein [Actinomycetota bacterium]
MKLRLISILALAVLVGASVAATASANGKGKLFQFRGELVAASTGSVQLQVEGGNHAALRAMLGQSQNQTFTVGTKTEILIWRKGVPTVGTTADLKQGDWVNVNVRGKAGASLADLEASPAGIIGDRVSKPTGGQPLFLYVGTVAGAQSGGHLALHVKAGNRLALRSLLGQSADQTFTYDDGTIFLLWQGKVPTVIDASQLKAGDRITVRIRAPRASTLAQVEATAANHVGDHEPGNPATQND